jgi:uncharacterized protein
MSRPCKCRRVASMPGVTYFKPAGIPLRALEEVQLSIEEAEAIRLKDLEGMEQEEAAVRMAVSRPTFQRILASARRKIADVLLNGKAVRIEGGHFEVTMQQFKCANDHEWNIPQEKLRDNPPVKCPVCGNPEITAAEATVSRLSVDNRCCQRNPGWRNPKCHSKMENDGRI